MKFRLRPAFLFIITATTLLLINSTAAAAQTNPGTVEFTSADHAAVEVTGYELDIRFCSTPTTCTSVIQTITIAKSAVTPIASTNPQQYRASINVQPITFGSYAGVMRTVAGAIKSADSVPSDIFVRAPGPPSKPVFK